MITEQKIPETLKIKCLVCKPEEKIGQLIALWEEYPRYKFMVYFANGAEVDFFFKYLSGITNRYVCCFIHILTRYLIYTLTATLMLPYTILTILQIPSLPPRKDGPKET